jgi:hypothetical protein
MSGNPPAASSEDARALERYRYLVRTAPPETVEQAHEEAFARLTPEQRKQVIAELANSAPAAERAAVQNIPSDDPRAMARAATRAEIRQPGSMERTLGNGAGGFGGSLLGSFAAAFAGSLVAQSFFSAIGGFGGENDASAEADAAPDEAADGGDLSGGDFGDGGLGGDFEV